MFNISINTENSTKMISCTEGFDPKQAVEAHGFDPDTVDFTVQE